MRVGSSKMAIFRSLYISNFHIQGHSYYTVLCSPLMAFYVAAKATYIRLLHGKIGFWGGFFGPSSVKRGRTHIVLVV